MKKYLALLLALAMCMSMLLTACGGDSAEETTDSSAAADTSTTVEVEEEEEEYVEEEVYVEEEEEVEIYDISDSLAGSIWIDDELVVYGFEEDASTLYLILPDGTEMVGEYYLEADTTGAAALGIYVADAGVDIYALMTDMTDEYLEFVDVASGVTTILVPVDADAVVEEETAVDGEIYDISDSLAGSVWIDDELVVYGFEEDASTLYLVFPDGTEMVGEYYLEADTTGAAALGIYVADAGVDIYALMTDMTDDYLEFVDIASGVTTILVPVA